ncbi:putative mfs multidrug transporter [Diaporthe ampelina]|uniref:Putative mfs multidrug transporter n=1 Tax=Diaporthe ampelina TaxID=1214573 RepID=A0A0G2HXK8_9PEZI|nr:putative mfs multidrug transporter [Diaporthe ampelina]
MDTPISTAPMLAGDRTLTAGQPLSDASDSSPDTAGEPDRDLEPGCGPGEDGTAEKRRQGSSTAANDDNIISWDGPDDPECPRNWPARRKALFVIVTSGMVTCVSFGSSVFAPAEHVFAEAFGVPLAVGQLGVALWILGFFAGPIFFGPVSELCGHLVPLAVAVAGMSVFQVPIALGANVRTVLACRFLSGAFGSGAFAVVSGTYFELYEPIPRGVALAASGMSINLGATVAPVAGAFLSYEAHWRWTAWATLIFAGVLCFAALFTVRETSSRRILQLKARRMRLETGDWALHAKSEETPVDLGDIVRRYLTKPVRIIVQEPILVILTAYLTLVYGILYLSFQAFPAAYQQRGWSVPMSDLPFLAVLLGAVSAFLTCALYTMTYYKRRVLANNGATEPEWRLPPMILGAGLLPPSLLWFGWSGNVHWMCQVMASYVIGYGLLLIFITGIVYLVDVYQHHANSAMSIHVIIRSLVASSFPLWANIMYDHLGIPWGTSLLAFLCTVMLCAPVTFYCFGARIRSWSRFSVRGAI